MDNPTMAFIDKASAAFRAGDSHRPAHLSEVATLFHNAGIKKAMFVSTPDGNKHLIYKIRGKWVSGGLLSHYWCLEIDDGAAQPSPMIMPRDGAAGVPEYPAHTIVTGATDAASRVVAMLYLMAAA